MKKRILRWSSFILALTLVMTSLIGCGSKSTTDQSKSGTPAVQEKQLGADTAGENATELSYWTFVDLHGKHFEKMLELWNKENPDRQIKLNVTVMPYDDMHNKLLIAVQTGQGAPDISDIELGRFPDFLAGDEVPLVDLTDAVEPYRDKIVESRLGIYSKDGKVYGFPTHVGGTVAFYNTEILEQAGVDYRTIKTWEDYKQAGIKVYEATGKYLGTADTSATWQVSMLLAQQGSDLTDENGNPRVNSPELIKGLEMLKDLQENNVIATIPGGQPDTEEAKGEYNMGNYASALMPLWYMSRFTNEITDLKGKIAIAPLPVFEEGQPRSLGLGGTGTVVTKTAKDIQLAKDFLTFAKISEQANIEIWNTLGFDPVNTEVWTNKEITHNPDNEFVQYFQNNPFDVLNEVKDEIQMIKSTSASPTINNVLCTVTLNAIFEDGQDVTEALNEAQEMIEQELQ
ncbi:ABC transporter substrate-binding protein [Defluviitalea raffinosedens]|jgi:arabinosaccharide transport system substrate-binding protein|uniref:Extracellular solute-binding protein n=1 Tax=Defluviitalea raffinosedens TaxID=1450156 RepID=A0A7C8HFK5_9FIRM|nr:sugar ABC transporter substrate-binding protein [Defluviitalea raffinosedens]KAE9636043.1 extracellular solute-binding protein [Defluviitalea raffinosedens]MBM7685114.1 arabinosaccharide transport system substrate-binding protein [Defluviitalea raffinosedens]HHW67422.1 sugar ABC transporter substrate-binding protein [Candidatus Epulonipiscium sp.]